MNATLKKEISIFIMVAIFWGIAWKCCSILDEHYCTSHGVEYAGTSLALEGFCRISGVEVPAENLLK